MINVHITVGSNNRFTSWSSLKQRYNSQQWRRRSRFSSSSKIRTVKKEISCLFSSLIHFHKLRHGSSVPFTPCPVIVFVSLCLRPCSRSCACSCLFLVPHGMCFWICVLHFAFFDLNFSFLFALCSAFWFVLCLVLGCYFVTCPRFVCFWFLYSALK